MLGVSFAPTRDTGLPILVHEPAPSTFIQSALQTPTQDYERVHKEEVLPFVYEQHIDCVRATASFDLRVSVNVETVQSFDCVQVGC
jgi:hypothetical protein